MYTRPIQRLFCIAQKRSGSTWAHVPQGPPDAILGLTVAFNNDTHPNKVNLGQGSYRDDNGKPYVLECVRRAEEKLIGKVDHEYAGISGVAAFNTVSQQLLLSPESQALKDNRVTTQQTLSGTGSLRVAASFLERFYPSKEIFLPTPTWANHGPIMRDSGLKPLSYRYYRPTDCGLDFAGMIEDIKAAPNKSIILLHACAHNPTGVDPTLEQWKEIAQVMKDKGHFPFFDAAYQGFASGDPERDAAPIRYFISQGFDLLACQSFAKNFGLYGQRAGALHFVCNNAEEKNRVDSQLKIVIRPMYSNPPVHGARIVAKVLEDPELSKLWRTEVKGMADRIMSMRLKLVDALKKNGSVKDWSHVINQIGMFTYTGLNKDQVNKLINDYHIYLTQDGRISVAGLTSKNVEYIASSIHQVTK